MNEQAPARFRERAWTLVRRTIGDRDAVSAKLRRAKETLRNYVFPRRIQSRLRKLEDLGYIRMIPNRTQLLFGSLDMFRFFIIPCASDYYARKNITFGFHTLLRILDDPASMMDPTGFMSEKDVIIGHLMQVTHADPIYDLQLLSAHEEGLEELERQVEQIIEGTHPRTESIGAIIEDPGYHERLLTHVRDFRSNPSRCELLQRENIQNNPHFIEIAETFGNLYTTIEYFASLPDRPLFAAFRALRVREFPGGPQARPYKKPVRTQARPYKKPVQTQTAASAVIPAHAA